MASNFLLTDLIPFLCSQGLLKDVCPYLSLFWYDVLTVIYTLMPGLPLDPTAMSRPALSDEQSLTQPLLSSWLFQPPSLLHQVPTRPAIGTIFKYLCWFFAYQREEDIIIHHSHAVWEFGEGTCLDTSRATRPSSCGFKAVGLGTARRNQGKWSAGMTLILCRKWSGKKICHLKPDWEQPCRNLTGLKWCQLVSDLTHLHFTEHWQTPEAASSREVPASLWGAEHPKPASEAKKANKSVIQQLISCISIAKERETPFCSKGWPFPSEALISKPHISLCACSPASSEPFQTSWPRTEWSSAAATTGPAFKCGNTSAWRRQAVPQLVSCNFGVIWACLAPGEAEGAHVRCPPHWLCQLN